jgi:catechol 2,3-dioxygenase-like lactoylglutathione lyase family enzyme
MAGVFSGITFRLRRDRNGYYLHIMLTELDHLVLTVADIDATCAFYVTHLGMTRINFGAGRVALAFGNQKINLHQAGREFEPKAARPTPGSADLCFRTPEPVERIAAALTAKGVPVIEGPVDRTGARGRLRSIYLRDPDGNLLELANEVDHGATSAGA